MKSPTNSATVLHPSEEAPRTHAEHGFEDGWGTALDQLLELAKPM